MTTSAGYRKQEQEPASSQVDEVAPGVLRLQLPVSMPGLGHVNCYALEDADGVVLIDPGLPGPRSWGALGDRLHSAGLPLGRVHTAIVTHSHPDHYGGSHQLREETGAALVAHDAFTPGPAAVLANDDIDPEMLALDEETLIELWKSKLDELGTTPWGNRRQPPPDEAIRSWIQMSDSETPPRFRVPEPTIRVADGDPLVLAGREWFFVHTPGHTRDHICLWDPAEGILLSGDHVLPTITPHIAGSATPHSAGSAAADDPLSSFFASLERVGSFSGVTVCLPAHGHPFSDLRGRTEAIHKHHIERLETLRQAADALSDAPVEAFMQVLFTERAWGEMAASETFAHLEHFRATGKATARRDPEGLLRYRIRAGAQIGATC